MSRAQTHRGTPAIQRMVEYAPATGALALWMHHRDNDSLDADLLAANDGTCIDYGPGFTRLPLPLQTGLVAHQVLHVALRHAQRLAELRRLLGDLDETLANICADAIVNSSLSHLSWLELPPGSVLLEDLVSGALEVRQGAAQALLEWDLERLYRALDDRRSGLRAAGQRAAASGSEVHRESAGKAGSQPAADSGEHTQPRDSGERAARARAIGARSPRDLLPAPDTAHPELEAEQSREWRERLLRAHAGDGPYSMLRELLADLPRVRTPWEALLRTRLARGLSRQPALSWSRPARSYLANQGRSGRRGQPGRLRMPWEPGTAAQRAVAKLVVMVDVSGSIADPLLERFAREVEAITRRLESRLIVIVGDDRVRDVQSFEPGRSNLRGIRFQGGGGTDFTPLLEEAARRDPDIGVVLTDLEGPARFQPAFPVLWAVPLAHAAMEPPFGSKLVLD